MKKIRRVLFCIITIFIFSSIYAADNDQIEESLQVDNYLEVFEDYISDNDIDEIDVRKIYEDLISGNGVKYENIIDAIVGNATKQVLSTLKSVVSIFIIIIILAILSSIQLQNDSDVNKITKLVVFIAVCSILLANYLEIVAMFKNIVNTIGYIMQVVSTFLLGILVATGKISTTGIVEPMLLFISNAICFLTEYISIPFFTISIAVNIVSKISENIRMTNLSNMFRKVSLYAFTAMIGVFLLVLSMETTVTKSMDGIYFKTAQSVVSNAVPVVGGFLSDSLNTVLGATELIGKVGGIVSLIISIVIVSIPVIKILSVIVLYNILIALSEPVNEDKNIEELLRGFSNVYKDMLGIVVGVMILFIMSTGIIMNMLSVVSG